MRRTELEELLWQEIDGTLSGADRARLERAEATAPEVEELRHSLAAMTGLLGELGEVAPPEELRARVRSEIAARAASPAGPTGATGFGAWIGAAAADLRAALAVRWPARLAYATIGLLIGALGLSVWGRQLDSGLDRAELVGALGRDPAATAAATGDGFAVELPAGAGRLTFTLSGDGIVADLSLETAAPLTITLERPGEPLLLTGLEGTLDGLEVLSLTEGRIALEFMGRGHRRLFVGPVSGAPLSLRVASGERELVAATVDPRELP